jgi:hypothetical protein
MFGNRMLRKIFGPKSEDVTGERKKLRNEELNDLSSSQIIRVMNSRKRRCVGHVARMRKEVYTEHV